MRRHLGLCNRQILVEKTHDWLVSCQHDCSVTASASIGIGFRSFPVRHTYSLILATDVSGSLLFGKALQIKNHLGVDFSGFFHKVARGLQRSAYGQQCRYLSDLNDEEQQQIEPLVAAYLDGGSSAALSMEANSSLV